MAEDGREGEAPVALNWRLERRVVRNAIERYVSAGDGHWPKRTYWR